MNWPSTHVTRLVRPLDVTFDSLAKFTDIPVISTFVHDRAVIRSERFMDVAWSRQIMTRDVTSSSIVALTLIIRLCI